MLARRLPAVVLLLALPILAVAGTSKSGTFKPPTAEVVQPLAAATLAELQAAAFGNLPDKRIGWMITTTVSHFAPHASGVHAGLNWEGMENVPDRYLTSDLVVAEASVCEPYEDKRICTYPMQARFVIKVRITSNHGKVREAIVPLTLDCKWDGRYLIGGKGAPEHWMWEGGACSEVPGTHVIPPGGDDRAVGKKQIDMGHFEDLAIEGGEVKRNGEGLFRGFVDTSTAAEGYWTAAFHDTTNRRFMTMFVEPSQGGILFDVQFHVADVHYRKIYPTGTTIAQLVDTFLDQGVVTDDGLNPDGFAKYAEANGIEAASWAQVANTWLTRVYNPLGKTMYVYAGMPAKSDFEGKGQTYMIWQGKATNVTLHKGEVLCVVQSHDLVGCVNLPRGTSPVVIASTGLGFQ